MSGGKILQAGTSEEWLTIKIIDIFIEPHGGFRVINAIYQILWCDPLKARVNMEGKQWTGIQAQCIPIESGEACIQCTHYR